MEFPHVHRHTLSRNKCLSSLQADKNVSSNFDLDADVVCAES